MNLGRILPGALAALVALAVTASAAIAESHGTRSPDFIMALAEQATAVLSKQDMPLEEREERLRSLLDEGFALDKIGRFVVGRAWREMSPDQRDDYLKLYAEWVLKNYSSQFGGYSGQTFSIVKTVDRGKKDVFVRSQIEQPAGGPPINADWRVREIDGELKVVDVVIEGISMLVTQRSEFATVLQKHGVEGLIETLRARVSKYPALSG